MPDSRSPSLGVIQGSFWNGRPVWPAQARPAATGAAVRPLAAHVQAAVARFSPPRPGPSTLQRSPHPVARAAPPDRIGNALRVPPTVQLAAAGPGQPLPVAFRQEMEGLFRTDFSAVRVHVGPQAQQLGARAMTLGSSIFFAPGHFDMQTVHGRRLLTHELTHVVQQRSGQVRNPFGNALAVVIDPGLEAEAERMSLRMAARAAAPARGVISLAPAPARPQGAGRPAAPHRPATTLQRMEIEADDESEVESKVKKKKKVSLKASKWILRDEIEDQKEISVDSISGNTGSGYSLGGTKNVEKRKKRDYSSSRVEQVLGQISNQLYFALKFGDEDIKEVEAMWAGGSLFLAGNQRSESAALYKFLTTKEADEVWRFLTSSYGKSKTGKGYRTTRRKGSKLKLVKEGKREVGEGKLVVQTLVKPDVGWIDLLDSDADSTAQEALANSGGVYVVTGQDKRHAEVKLVKVLEVAGHKSGAVVQGKKRPCYTCAAYMRLRKQQGYGVLFSDNPGKLWKDEFDRSEKEVQKAIILALEKGIKSYKTDIGEQYRSDSESEVEEKNLTKTNFKKTLKRKTEKEIDEDEPKQKKKKK